MSKNVIIGILLVALIAAIAIIVLLSVEAYNLEWLVKMKDQVIGLWELNSQYWCN